jgi:hypothetical protein
MKCNEIRQVVKNYTRFEFLYTVYLPYLICGCISLAIASAAAAAVRGKSAGILKKSNKEKKNRKI